MPDDRAIESWAGRIAAEFREGPGLRLTAGQAARLWALEKVTADTILDRLVRSGQLVRTSDGAFTRAGERPFTTTSV